MIDQLTLVTPLKAVCRYRLRNWSVLQQHFRNIGVDWIVAENSSLAANVPGVRRIAIEPFSIAAARNAGMKEVNTDHVCFIDADLLIRKSDFYAAYKAFLEGDYDIYSPYDTVVRCGRQNSSIASERGDYIRWSYLKQKRGNYRQAANFCGGSVFMKTEVARELGGYDERFVEWGFEDVALDKLAKKSRKRMGMHRADSFHLWHPRVSGLASSKRFFETEYRLPIASVVERKSLVSINRFEYHVTDTCNLHCVQCSHYSNFTTKGMRTVDQVREELEPWSTRILPGMVCLLGGEPTVNKDLVPIMYLVSELFPRSEIMLVTNGFFLQKHPDLASAVAELDVNLQVSKHHESVEYNQKFSEILSVLEQWKQDVEGFNFHVRRSLKKWMQQYDVRDDGKAYPIRSRPTYAWSACVQKYCHQIYRGKLWKCPAIAYFKNLEEKLGLQEVADWDRFRAYQPLSPDCSTFELQNFVYEKAISACGLCPQNPKKIPIPNPMHLPVIES